MKEEMIEIIGEMANHEARNDGSNGSPEAENGLHEL